MAARTPVEQGPVLPTREQFNKWLKSEVEKNPHFIPPNQLCLEDINDWTAAKDELTNAKAREAILREKIYRFLFPAPREGTNYVQVPNGPKFKADRKIDRKADQSQIDTLKRMTVGAMRTFLTQLGIDNASFPDDMPVTHALNLAMDKLIKYDPSLSTSDYRELTESQRAVFEMCLIIKDGSPQLSIVPPKET